MACDVDSSARACQSQLELGYNERLKRLDLLQLVHRREVKNLTNFYKFKCGYYNCAFNSYFEFCSDNYNKRLKSYSSNKLQLNLVRTELFEGTVFEIEFLIYGII